MFEDVFNDCQFIINLLCLRLSHHITTSPCTHSVFCFFHHYSTFELFENFRVCDRYTYLVVGCSVTRGCIWKCALPLVMVVGQGGDCSWARNTVSVAGIVEFAECCSSAEFAHAKAWRLQRVTVPRVSSLQRYNPLVVLRCFLTLFSALIYSLSLSQGSDGNW